MNNFLEKTFHLKDNKTTIKTEIIAGITTFMAMAYILFVNPGMFEALGVVNFSAMYISTAISAIIGTVLIGLLANLPLAQAPGMGLNAFFVYTVCMGLGFTYANSLLFVLFDGLLFVVFTLTGLRKQIFNAIPRTVKAAIPVGIGLFIAFIGLQDAHIVIPDASTGVTLASFNLLGNATWASIVPMLITIVTLLAIAILMKKQVKGAILWSILGGTVLYYLCGLTIPDFYATFTITTFNPLDAFKDFGELAFFKVFTEGFDFSAYLANHSVGSLILTLITTSLAFCLVDMFDTMGTLFGACKTGDMLVKDKEGNEHVPNMDRAMLADAVATCAGAVCGTSTVTTYVEASSGVAAGGRTGLSAMVTAGMFAIAMFLSPIASLVPACAYAAALIYVGILMMSSVTSIDWKNPAIALPSFMTIVMMPFTYNISYGIAFGLLARVVMMLFGRHKEDVTVGTWIITGLFIAMFFLTH